MVCFIRTIAKPDGVSLFNHFILSAEVEAGIKAKLNAKLKEHNLGQHLNHIWKHIRKEFLSHIDYNDYGLTETVRVKYFDAEVCESFLLHRDLKTKVELLDLIEEFFEVCCNPYICSFLLLNT